MAERVLLTSQQMATFVARGFLRFDASCPDDINQQFLDEVGRPPQPGEACARRTRNCCPAAASRPLPAGTAARRQLSEGLGHQPDARSAASCAARSTASSDPNPRFDHHFLHVTFPPEFYAARGLPNVSQHTHQDSTIDPRRAFDIQIMYYPHDVTREMGGTRFVPGTHLRIVSEAAVARYQNIRGQQHVVCPAGHAAGSAPRHLARRRREPFRPIALHVQDPHQPDSAAAAAVGYVGSAERSLSSSGRSS